MNSPSQQPSDRPGTAEVPDFALIRLIGEGAFGTVWLASNQTTGRLRAVKVIPLRSASAGSPARREIVSLKHLEAHIEDQHPNLLTIYHVGRTAEHLFYVMDLADDVSGAAASADASYRPATMERRLEGGPLPADECLALTRQLLAGLAVLHQAGMVHRDVKPANCLFVGGQLKVADFGLLTEDGPLVSSLGTRRYMPPDGRMDAKADVYAAGLVLYQMLTDLPAENFPSLGARAREIAGNPLLQRLNRVSLRAAQREPAKRFQHAGAMLAELEASASRRRRLGRRILVWAAGVVLAAVAVTEVLWHTESWREASVMEATVPPEVEVNFLTEPYFNATIHVDGTLLEDAKGKPYVTPCTVPTVLTGEHRVVFKHAQHEDLDAGRIDFGTVREVDARWSAAGR
ncbi:MAG: serine/threonine-protein kinase [Pirellulales bacterium]